MTMDLSALAEAAQEVRARAYAPYSKYLVGAAILGADGKVYTGVNVENLSFGLTICAERSAVSAMILGGCSEIAAVAVATRDGGTPCGACRQVLVEFCPNPHSVPVGCVGEAKPLVQTTLGELLPDGFTTNL
jgi:cytidine deaminase